MVQIIWEYLVKEGYQGRFELAYGPGGAWSNLFGRCSGFRGITLLRDIRDPRRYLTIDLWDSESEREQALASNKEEYAEFDSSFAECINSATEVGSFKVREQATVRPRARSRRR